MSHNILKGLFLKNRSTKALNLALNGNFSILSHSSANFVTIATVKVKEKPGYYTSVILLIKQ